MAEQALALSILTFSGQSHAVEAQSNWTIRDVKDAITSITQVAHHQQRLLLGDRVLSDTDILGDLMPDICRQDIFLVCCADDVKAGVIAEIVTGRRLLRDVEEVYRDDRDVVEAALFRDGLALQVVSGHLQKDRDLVLIALAQNGFALRYAPNEFCSDREAVLLAAKSNSFSITYADDALLNDRGFVDEAVHTNVFVKDFLPKGLLTTGNASAQGNSSVARPSAQGAGTTPSAAAEEKGRQPAKRRKVPSLVRMLRPLFAR